MELSLGLGGSKGGRHRNQILKHKKELEGNAPIFQEQVCLVGSIMVIKDFSLYMFVFSILSN